MDTVPYSGWSLGPRTQEYHRRSTSSVQSQCALRSQSLPSWCIPACPGAGSLAWGPCRWCLGCGDTRRRWQRRRCRNEWWCHRTNLKKKFKFITLSAFFVCFFTYLCLWELSTALLQVKPPWACRYISCPWRSCTAWNNPTISLKSFIRKTIAWHMQVLHQHFVTQTLFYICFNSNVFVN